jgi:hypothetical protein
MVRATQDISKDHIVYVLSRKLACTALDVDLYTPNELVQSLHALSSKHRND